MAVSIATIAEAANIMSDLLTHKRYRDMKIPESSFHVESMTSV